MRILALAATVTAIWGCAPAAVVRPAMRPAVDAAAVKSTLQHLWMDELGALERGDLEAFGAKVLPGVFAVGVESKDLAASRAEWLRQLGAVWKPGRYAVRSTSPVIGVTSDGRAAWLSDVVDVTPAGQQKGAVGVRVTQVFAEADGQWWVAASCWSAGTNTPTARYKERPLDGGIASGATSVVAVYERGLVSTDEFLGALSARTEAGFFGLGPDERVEGGPSIKEVLAEQLKTLGVHYRRLGELHADVTPNGRVGWIAGQVEVTLPSKLRVAARALFAYENEGGLWRQVLGHLSLPVDGMGGVSRP